MSDVPVSLSQVIAWIESRENPHALRFEPAVYFSLTNGAMTPAHAAIVHRIMQIHNCSIATAQCIYSTSYGLYQLMGFNLYADDSVNSTDLDVVSFCSNTDEQTRIFNAFVSREAIAWTPADLASSSVKRLTFGRTYNGDALAYATEIAASLKHFGLQVV
jgi:hypothetical protein